MAKKGGFSFDGLVDPAAQPAAPIDGVEQRGATAELKATPKALPRAKAAQSRPQEARKRGRPSKDRTSNEARPSFGLDPETHMLFKVWLLKNGVTMQDYLEQHIAGLVKGMKL